MLQWKFKIDMNKLMIEEVFYHRVSVASFILIVIPFSRQHDQIRVWRIVASSLCPSIQYSFVKRFSFIKYCQDRSYFIHDCLFLVFSTAWNYLHFILDVNVMIQKFFLCVPQEVWCNAVWTNKYPAILYPMRNLVRALMW